MRFSSSPFPPPFSGHRHRRVGGGDDPGGGDCAGAHRSRPQRRGRGTLPTNPARGPLRPPSEGRPVPDFERLPLGSYKQSSRLSPEPRAPTYAEESRVHLAASLGDRSLSQRAPRRRDGGRDRQKGAQRPEAARAATPAPPPPPAGLRMRLLSAPRERRACASAPGRPPFARRRGEPGDWNQWKEEGESLGRPTLPIFFCGARSAVFARLELILPLIRSGRVRGGGELRRDGVGKPQSWGAWVVIKENACLGVARYASLLLSL